MGKPHAHEVREDIVTSTRTGQHRKPFKKSLEILGYIFNKAGRKTGRKCRVKYRTEFKDCSDKKEDENFTVYCQRTARTEAAFSL